MEYRSGAIGEQLVAVGWRVGDFQYQAVMLAAEFADSFEWVADGYSSAGLWIADSLDIARRTANEWIRIGRSLDELPITAAAFEAKNISFAKVRVLTRSATPENEAELVAIAETVAASELPKEIARWLQGTETEDAIDTRHHDSRSLSWQNEPDGMITASMTMSMATTEMTSCSVTKTSTPSRVATAKMCWTAEPGRTN